MQGKQLRKLEAELWRAADQLRANSKLTASEYSMPVLGLIFLRHAFNRFEKVKDEIEKDLPCHPQRGRRAVTKNDYLEKNAMYLPEKSRFDYLVSLPEDEDIGEAIDEAMRQIEEEYDNLKVYFQKTSRFSARICYGSCYAFLTRKYCKRLRAICLARYTSTFWVSLP